MKLGIIGLGLMGGSFALACKNNYNFSEIVGIDHNKKHCEDALKLNLVDRIIDIEISDADLEDIISELYQTEGKKVENT